MDAAATEDEKQKPKKGIEVIRPSVHTCETHGVADEECNRKNQVGVVQKLTKNGGITKMVVKPGTCSCSNKPLYGDEVTGQSTTHCCSVSPHGLRNQNRIMFFLCSSRSYGDFNLEQHMQCNVVCSLM